MNPTLLLPYTPPVSRSLLNKHPKKPRHSLQKMHPMPSNANLGVLTTNKKIDFLRMYLVAAETAGVTAFVFTPLDVNWAQMTVSGMTLVRHGDRYVWLRQTYPFPDVVYNQIKNRRAEMRPEVIHLKKEFAKRGIQFFNPGFFSKHEVYDLLTDTKHADMLPTTHTFSNPQVFENMLREFSLLYIKPSGGSLGKGILRVEKRADSYMVTVRQGELTHSFSFKRTSNLFQYLRLVCGKRKYVIQQGIILKQIDGAPTDFRVHLHKNGRAEWNVVAIGGKVAGDGSITTHVHSGGRVMDVDEILDIWYAERKTEMKHKLVTRAIQLAEFLEEHMQGIIGELGLDMGIDQADRIWLFEVNSKPGKAIFKIPGLKEKKLMSARHIVEFASSLATPAGKTAKG